MAVYPALPTSYGSDPDPLVKLHIDRAEDGTARVRSTSNDKVRIKIKHEFLTVSNKQALDIFYAANRLLAFSYTSPADGLTRNCLFTQAPQYKVVPGGYWEAEILVEEV